MLLKGVYCPWAYVYGVCINGLERESSIRGRRIRIILPFMARINSDPVPCEATRPKVCVGKNAVIGLGGSGRGCRGTNPFICPVLVLYATSM